MAPCLPSNHCTHHKKGVHRDSPLVPCTAACPPPLSISSWVPAALPGARREEGCLATAFLIQPRKAASHPQNSPQLYETGCQQRSVACIDQA